jgi:hypothetical protein
MVGSSIYAADGLLASGAGIPIPAPDLDHAPDPLGDVVSSQKIMIRIRSMSRMG